MASEIKVEIIHKETIKPSSPTPHHLAKSKLSIFYQITPEIYVPLPLLYPSNNSDDEVDHHSLFSERSHLLKTSLSEALTHFNVFAGEFEYNVSISYNDHGAGFIESQVYCPTSKVLDKPNFGILKQLIPTAIESKQAEAGHLLLVQVNLFECGGLTIGVSISHKSLVLHLLSSQHKILSTHPNQKLGWAAIALGSASTTDHVLLPTEFGVASTLFPPQDFFNSPQPTVEFAIGNCVTKRFVFDASKIAALKSKAASETVSNPTKGIEQYKEKYPNGVSGEDIFQAIKGSGNLAERDDLQTNTCSSWCRLPLYETEFGWGKPSWVSTCSTVKNTIMLMDLSDGEGIEASVTLKEEDMTIIESNEELLAYASLNPTVI
ncbi:hypothetical protein CerSpe_268510 [Prunus speciosa]